MLHLAVEATTHSLVRIKTRNARTDPSTYCVADFFTPFANSDENVEFTTIILEYYSIIV